MFGTYQRWGASNLLIIPTRVKIRLAKAVSDLVILSRRLFGRGPSTKVMRGDLVWDLDLREGIDFSIYLLGSFEPRTIAAYKRILKPGHVVLDIGANIGAHTLPMAQQVGRNGRVISFEPTGVGCSKLQTNLDCNEDIADTVTLLRVMLMANDGASIPEEVFASWPFRPEHAHHPLHLGVAVRTDGAVARSLDSVAEEMRLDRVDFVKIDVDGYEMDVLSGAVSTLNRFQPTILMEIAPYMLEERGIDGHAPMVFLGDLGYRFFDFGGRPLPDAREIAARIPSGASINVIAKPIERP